MSYDHLTELEKILDKYKWPIISHYGESDESSIAKEWLEGLKDDIASIEALFLKQSIVNRINELEAIPTAEEQNEWDAVDILTRVNRYIDKRIEHLQGLK